MTKYDIGIIGAGPAGYTAALHASKKGFSVVLFERDYVGGVCLNRGCIPTKSIMHSADFFEELKCAQNLGISVSDAKVDFTKVIERKNQIVAKLRKSLELMLKNSKVTVINTDAEIINKNTIISNGEKYTCDKIIAATGSEPKTFEGMEFDGEKILSSDDVLNLTELPKSIAIIGSGAIGIEWARIFSAFGVNVTIIEGAENLLPVADIEVSKRIERLFKVKKIEIKKGCYVTKIERNNLCNIHLSSGEFIEVEKVLVAIGRKPRATNKIDGITYLGDVCGEVQLAHFAIKQAISEIDDVYFEKTLIPSVIYGTPEIAWVGKREQDLEEGSYKKSTILISALGKSHCDNSSDGFIKVLSQDEKIVGVHIMSKEASSLVQQVLIAIQNNISIDKLKEICYAHPTYSEGIFEALFSL